MLTYYFSCHEMLLVCLLQIHSVARLNSDAKNAKIFIYSNVLDYGQTEMLWYPGGLADPLT